MIRNCLDGPSQASKKLFIGHNNLNDQSREYFIDLFESKIQVLISGKCSDKVQKQSYNRLPYCKKNLTT